MLAMAAAMLLAGACSKKSSGGSKLKSDADSVAYILGMNIGNELMQRDSAMNVNAVCEGIRDAFAQKTKLSDEEAKAYYLRYVNVSVPEKALAEEDLFLNRLVEKDRNFKRRPSGVTYYPVVIGNQEQIPISDRDSITLLYSIRTPDQTLIYSSAERGDTLHTRLGTLNKGMKESVKLIGEGGKIYVWIPSSLAYGSAGDAQLGIRPNTLLYYEIDLLKLDKYTNWSQRNNLRR